MELKAIWLKNSCKPFEPLIIKWRLRFAWCKWCGKNYPYAVTLRYSDTDLWENYFGREKHICTRGEVP